MESDTTLQKYLESVLSAQTMPASADVVGAIAICHQSRATELAAVYIGISELQRAIYSVRESWDQLGASDVRTRFQSDAVRAGIFLGLAKRIGSRRQIAKFRQELIDRDDLESEHAKAAYAEWLGEIIDFIEDGARPKRQAVGAFLDPPDKAQKQTGESEILVGATAIDEEPFKS
jgi:hypothetical protein